MEFHQFLSDSQPEAKTFPILHFSLELDVGINALDMLSGQPAAMVTHGKFNFLAHRF